MTSSIMTGLEAGAAIPARLFITIEFQCACFSINNHLTSVCRRELLNDGALAHSKCISRMDGSGPIGVVEASPPLDRGV